MKNRSVVPLSYAVAAGSFCAAAYSMIMHSEDAMISLIICLFAQVIFAVLAIHELRMSEYLTRNEKAIWTTFLLLFSFPMGIIYLTGIRKKILYR